MTTWARAWVTGVVLATAVLAGPWVPSSALAVAPVATHPGAAKIFRSILPVLHRTRVPVVLPTLAMLGKYFATVAGSGPGHYEIVVGYVPNCQGHACEFGDFEAHQVSRADARLQGKVVHLPHGVTGYFVNFTCGANCGDSTVSFDLHGYRYTYGLKAGSRADVVRVAASAVTAGPV